MDKKYACYCGLYCENCAVKAKVETAAKVLYDEMNKLGFEEIMPFFSNGEKFWIFLKGMTVEGICISCKEGSGNPTCKIRICAKEKNIEMCALCDKYPCSYFTEFFKGYPLLRSDNEVLSKNGWSSWGKLQDERKSKGIGIAYEKIK
ncbi:MAG: DUF3795 domain-containing protein [Fusobacteriaceae bacterium]|nr:DUF3795 domain-containing protein [Fusobacteriaceae bacterium]